MIAGKVTSAEIQQAIQQNPQASRQQIYALAAKRAYQNQQFDDQFDDQQNVLIKIVKNNF